MSSSSLMPDSLGETDLDFGACCGCGKEGPSVRNFVTLPLRAPVAGTGWGCFQCGLAPDGATAVVCDDCINRGKEVALDTILKTVMLGRPLDKQRAPYDSLNVPFEHDFSKHPETLPEAEERSPIADFGWLGDEEDAGIFAPGHLDPKMFRTLALQFDIEETDGFWLNEILDGGNEVQHIYWKYDSGSDLFQTCEASDEDALAVTVITW